MSFKMKKKNRKVDCDLISEEGAILLEVDVPAYFISFYVVLWSNLYFAVGSQKTLLES